MNKTFTAAIAITAVAGLASAEIATDPAGYVDVAGTESGQFVANPFGSFTGNPTTLGDIDGSNLNSGSTITIISDKGKKLFDAAYRTDVVDVGWWVIRDGGSYGDFTNSHPIARGEAIMFNGNNDVITMAGTLNNNGASVNLVKGHNFVGNVVAVNKPLSQFAVTGWTLNKDYLYVNDVKYTYLAKAKAGLSAGWYLYSDIKEGKTNATPQNSVIVPPGVGMHIYCYKAGTITLPGLE